MNQPKKPIQRTLIITGGETAAAAGNHLSVWLAQDRLPTEAVALLSMASENLVLDPDALAAALRQISQLANRIQLAQRGWQLDRLNEIAVFFILDKASCWTEKQLRSLVRQVSETAHHVVGVETAVALLILASDEAEGSDTLKLSPMAAPVDLFQRGIYVLGMVNEAGLRLTGTAELADRVARLLWTFIATPLRDAPEWLAEQSGYQTQAAGLVNSAGLTDWHWSAQGEQESLAVKWVASALATWLAEPDNEADFTDQVQLWLKQAGVGIKSLTEIVGALVRPLQTPRWVAPHPWQLREQYLKLYRGLQSLQTTAAEVITTLNQTIEPQLHETVQVLMAACRSRLSADPSGGLSRTQTFMQQIQLSFANLEYQMDDKEEQLQGQAEKIQTQAEALHGQMEAMLASWPEGEASSWLSYLLRPWRWPGLAWQYWQMHQLGRLFVKLYEQQSRIEHERVITAVMTDAYVDLQKRAASIESQICEIGDMLRHLQQTLPVESEGDATLLLPFFERFVDTPTLEAKTAAAAIGGLGRQLPNLDDSILNHLLAAGRERLQGVRAFTAFDLLSLLHESAEEGSAWLLSSWADAAPLWQFDEASLSETLRNLPTELTLIAATHLDAARYLADEAAQANWRWVELADPEHFIIVRLRSGIPVT